MRARACSPLPAAQDAWPTRPVKIVVPFVAGGTTDGGQALAKDLSEMWGQPVVVENRGGAGGNIGATSWRNGPDGYTLLMTSGSIFTVNPHIREDALDAKKDFIAVRTASGPQVVTVNPSIPAKTLKEFIAYAKSQPGKLNWSIGTQPVHMAGESFIDAAGIDLVHIPYRARRLRTPTS